MARRGRFFRQTLKTIADRDRSNNNEIQEGVSNHLVLMSRNPDIPPQVASLVEEFANDERIIGGIYARFAGRQQRAIGDGEILDRLLEWLSAGGLQDLLEFITALISIFGGLGVSSSSSVEGPPPMPYTPDKPGLPPIMS